MVSILSEDMRGISNKIKEYLDSITETNTLPDTDYESREDVPLDSMLTSKAGASKIANGINIAKLLQMLSLPQDKTELFKSGIEALQKNPPELDGQQAAALLLGFQSITNNSSINIGESVPITKGDDPKLDEILAKHPAELEKFKETGEFDNNELYMELYSHFLDSGEMPYGIAKARDGDPDQWLSNRLMAYIENASLDESVELTEDYNPAFSDQVRYEQVHDAIQKAVQFAPDAKDDALALLRALTKVAQSHQINDEVNALFNATLYVIKFATTGDRTNFLAVFHDIEAKFLNLETLSEREYGFVHAELEKFGRELWTRYLESYERAHPAKSVPAISTPV